ncbi:cupin domain-containing protein [Sinanaerobacter chloroacetimidivorans]|jgi:mannose-6-phosphate isomerase-like protein (cupin superfamily)|uniref:Cupin domain-containing protein n=1 Tax=Sinanaerobacter chloroacetimidivorans TaxID=2818044 RepID=A0A8J7VX05_9FIRM|nr:cupin domain-containing protein [Sinanaerobacter chloroacetimidivorans]MBR0596284.1 cupin domain-containing protein [Sinanaerobacter chloroacetimidivorans]
MLSKVNVLDAVNRGALYEYIEIGKMNHQMLNVVQVAQRTLDFHVHEESDELFYVVEGSFCLELKDGCIEMNTGDLLIVPKGIEHRPVCKELVKILLIDLSGALNNDNCGGTYRSHTKPDLTLMP